MGEPGTEWGKQAVTDIEGLKFDVNSLKSDVAGLKSDVSTLRSDVTSMRGDVAAMRNDFVEFRGEMRGMLRLAAGFALVFGLAFAGALWFSASGVVDLQARMGSVERSVDNLSARVDGLSDRVEGISDRLSRAEGKIDALAVAVGPGTTPSAVEPLRFDPEIDRAGGEGEPPLKAPED